MYTVTKTMSSRHTRCVINAGIRLHTSKNEAHMSAIQCLFVSFVIGLNYCFQGHPGAADGGERPSCLGVGNGVEGPNCLAPQEGEDARRHAEDTKGEKCFVRVGGVLQGANNARPLSDRSAARFHSKCGTKQRWATCWNTQKLRHVWNGFGP